MHKVLLISAGLIALGGVAGTAIHVYEHKPVPKPTVTVQQALQGQQNAQKLMQIHDLANNQRLAVSQAEVNQLTTKNTTLCNQIKTSKLNQPLCP